MTKMAEVRETLDMIADVSSEDAPSENAPSEDAPSEELQSLLHFLNNTRKDLLERYNVPA